MIRFILNVYIIVLVIDAILSFFPELRKYTWVQFVKKLSDFTCKPVRKYLPKDIGFDISHFVVIVALKLLIFLF